MTIPEKKEEWKKEFDGRFGNYWSKHIMNNVVYDGDLTQPPTQWIVVDRDDVKNFIAQATQEAYDRGAMEATEVCNLTIQEAVRKREEKIVGMVEGLRLEERRTPNEVQHHHLVIYGYNKACDDITARITSDKSDLPGN